MCFYQTHVTVNSFLEDKSAEVDGSGQLKIRLSSSLELDWHLLSSADFQDSKIQEQCNEATLGIDEQSIEKARTLVQDFLKEHRFIDLLPGHFAFGIIRRWINYTVNVRQRILEEDIRVFLSTEVWRLAKTRDHNSLKRRLRSAVREAEKIRQAQSNAGS